MIDTSKPINKVKYGDIELSIVEPTGEIEIIQNGEYDVRDKAVAKVSVSGGDGGDRTKLWRPPDMPDITSLQFQTDTECELYVTCDTNIKNNITISKIAGYRAHNPRVERGLIVNGEFIPNLILDYDDINPGGGYGGSITVELPEELGRFQIIHIVSVYGSKESWVLNEVDDPVVEIYTKEYSLRSVYRSTCYCVSLKYVTVENTCYDLGGSGYDFPPNNLEVLDISKINNFATAIGRVSFENLYALNTIAKPVSLTYKAQTLTFNNAKSIKECDLSWFDTSVITNLNNCFAYCESLKRLNLCNCDFSSVTSTSNTFVGVFNLKDVITNKSTKLPSKSFVLGGTALGLPYGDKLTNQSLINIANALPVASSALTLTLHTTPKTNLPNIIGNIVDGTFVANESGAVTLANFITETKGWTVA